MITEVITGATTAYVKIDIAGTIVTAAITNEAVAELELKKGQSAYAIIKASAVMIGTD
jgi:molybdopterin-binding protein